MPVVVAALPIPFAKRLEEQDMKIAEWPKASLPAEYYKDIKPVVGKIVTRSMVPGELVYPQRVREHLGGSTLSSLIKEGMRAVTVRVDDVAGVAGFIMPENRVDMLATREGTTYTLLRNVNVLAIDQEASPEKDKPIVFGL
ncbi:Flp pilus assembly protein CpaB [Methylogaea oryzae]|uniref:Flp pilus assembly protein CpaB n=1 Tax=Methylogaea oryzae TaxID=1295382 RepID=UPI0006D0EBA6|nr:Flp pilus assembly protein CpaB [Methylogaea oryzae]